MGLIEFIILVVVGMIAVVLLPIAVWKGAKAILWLVGHVFAFIFGVLGDALRFVGNVITSIIWVPMILLNVVIGRWSAAAHFGRAFQDEIAASGHCIYRIVIGRPARLLMLTPLTEGLEQRVPEVFKHAPGADRPKSKAATAFDGYTIVGSLKGGGSGAKLYLAEPDNLKKAAFERKGHAGVGTVVIKSFSVSEGSSLPQIVRESRALEAAARLGLVLDHDLKPDRFFYVMPYVPGDSLTTVTTRLHSRAGEQGLRGSELRAAMGYIADLLTTLDRYHRGGLWHKDIKPDNIIVSSDGHAHLVDLGLVTPLRSAMTLTTHGTEYFRDPEMVRLANRGAKVHEVDGVKFDLFGTGAVLYSVLENSFPAHGSLSSLSKRCPEALSWIVRRSMAEIHHRYASAEEMLADLRTVMNARDPWSVKPADLPSRNGFSPADDDDAGDEDVFAPAAAGAAVAAAAYSPVPPASPRDEASPRQGRKRRIDVRDWWKGGAVDTGAAEQPIAAPVSTYRPPVGPRASAKEQLERARKRAAAARQRAIAHARGVRQHHAKHHRPGPNAGIIGAVVIFIGLLGAGAFALFSADSRRVATVTAPMPPAQPAVSIPGAESASPAPASAPASPFPGSRSYALRLIDADSAGSLAIQLYLDGEWDEDDPLDDMRARVAFESTSNALRETPSTPINFMRQDIDAEAFFEAFPDAALVLTDEPDDADDLDSALGLLIDYFREAGIDVLGLGGEDDEVEAVAHARSVAGVSLFTNPEAATTLARWLDESDREDTFILHVEPGTADAPQWRIVLPGNEGVEEMARRVAALN
jgi:serine/threonine protein kinase